MLYLLDIPHLSASYCNAPTDPRVIVSVLCSGTEHRARSGLKAYDVTLKMTVIAFPVEAGSVSDQTQREKTR